MSRPGPLLPAPAPAPQAPEQPPPAAQQPPRPPQLPAGIPAVEPAPSRDAAPPQVYLPSGRRAARSAIRGLDRVTTGIQILEEAPDMIDRGRSALGRLWEWYSGLGPVGQALAQGGALLGGVGILHRLAGGPPREWCRRVAQTQARVDDVQCLDDGRCWPVTEERLSRCRTSTR